MKKLLLGSVVDDDTSKLESRRILVTNLLSVLSIIIFSIDTYSNYMAGFFLLATIESTFLPLLLINYITFQYTKNLYLAAGILTSIQSFTAIIALIVPGYGEEMAIFWVSSLPLYIFFLHGLKRGVVYSLINIFAIFVILLIVENELYPELFSIDLLVQVFVGYIAVSIFIYYMEKIRFEYENEVLSLASERKLLLKEVHHRVKNNMQIMISLLWLQSQKIKDPEDSKLFLDNADRLSAMSLIHENLYAVENLESIDLKTYFKKIVENLQTTTNHLLDYEISTLKVNMKDAMTLGLILNEIVTNSLQHAFKEGEKGEVSVKLRVDEKFNILTIQDTGTKLKSLDELHEGFGFSLVRDLVNSLKNANVKLKVNRGLQTEIRFEE